MLWKLRRLAPYLARQRRVIATILLLTLATAAISALHPWPMKLLVDRALSSHGGSPLSFAGWSSSPAAMILAAAGVSLLLFVIDSALNVALGLSWTLGGQRMVYDLAADAFARLQRMSLLFHSRRSVGDSISRLTEDTWCIYSVADGVMTPIQQAIVLISLACIGFAMDPILTAWCLGVAPLLAAASQFYGRRLKRRSLLGREASSRLMSFVHQTLGAMPMVQAFGAEDRNIGKFRRLANDAVALAQRGNLLGSSYEFVTGLITTLGMAVILYVGGMRVLAGAIPLGTLLVFIAYVRLMQGASGSLFKTFTNLKAAEASMDRLLELLDSQEFIPEAPGAKPLKELVQSPRGHVRLERVSFGYEPSQPVLHDIDLEVRPGEVIALVGPTGAGKSTLVSLIGRFVDPWQGRVLIDDVDIRQATVASVRENMSIVLQDPFLLPLSIAENIGYGRPTAVRDEIIQAAVAARADEFISRLPYGYDTILAERGATLSGGERQRLAIARALLKDAPVLILDEPTSALDSQTERLLLEALEHLMHGRTTFIVAHRLSTVFHANRIVVLEQGRIVESGSPQELLATDGLFGRLYRHQVAEPCGKVVA